MKFSDYLEKVQADKSYKDFISENPEAYLCAAFFIVDYKDGKDESSIDYFNPKDRKIVAFTLGKDIQARPLDVVQRGISPLKINENVQVEIEQIKGMLTDDMHNRGITNEIQKIILILQTTNNNLIWHCTAFLSGMNLLKVDIEDKSKSVIFMEKLTLIELLKPMNKLIAATEQKIKNNSKSKKKSGKLSKEEMKSILSKEVDNEKAEGNQEGFIG